jgi:hypothetical protein
MPVGLGEKTKEGLCLVYRVWMFPQRALSNNQHQRAQPIVALLASPSPTFLSFHSLSQVATLPWCGLQASVDVEFVVWKLSSSMAACIADLSRLTLGVRSSPSLFFRIHPDFICLGENAIR